MNGALDRDSPDLALWDWDAIVEREERAQRLSTDQPRCDVCGQPMWCGQHHRHNVCHPTTNGNQTRD